MKSTPDAPAEKPHAKAAGKPHNQCVAEVCGNVAGMPASFAKAADALEDIIRRANRAKQSTGILSAGNAMLLHSLSVDLAACLVIVEKHRKTADALSVHGVIPAEEEVDLGL